VYHDYSHAEEKRLAQDVARQRAVADVAKIVVKFL